MGSAASSGGGSRPPWGIIIGSVSAAIVLMVGLIALLASEDDDTAGSLEEVEAATVQVLTEGSFVDPVEGAVQDAAGAGTAFLIASDGTAVTNNHVVTGAASVEVRVGGAQPVDAEVLGVSECSDLAVLDIEGDGFPTVTLASGEPDTGTDVFVAGFPLGDPEYTLTKGIISKADADGETNWASVDGVVETDAKINPGNSGGPLVTQSGLVVGVNYAADPDADQNFAIKASLAAPIIERLRVGEDVESLGMNTQAVVSDDGSSSGIWVAAVSPGTPAADTGIEAGDLITEMNGLTVGTDGTMTDYCDILRSSGPEGAIAATVLRTTTGEVLSGEFNGAPLEVDGVLDGGGDGGSLSGDTATVSSDSGNVSAQAPAEWEVETGPDGFNVAPDLAAFNRSFESPGATVVVVPQPDDPTAAVAEFLTDVGADTGCEETGRQDYDNGEYAGIEVALTCGSAEALAVIGASGTGNAVIVLVQATSPADAEAARVVLNTIAEP